jgi:hypothetical protein
MYKIQSRTILGWFDIMGDFETIQEAQEKIPSIQKQLNYEGTSYQITSILRIVDTEEEGINDNYVYQKEYF